MLDIGIVNRGKGDDYKIKFLNDLIPGEEISGEIFIGEIKKRSIEKSESYEFFVIITNQDKKEKWVSKLVTSYYPETGNIYGEKGGRIYIFIDTLNHAINDQPLNQEDSYSVNFKTLRKAVNDHIPRAMVRAVKPMNPHAKYVNLEVVDAQTKDNMPKQGVSSLEELAEENGVIHIAYANIKAEGKVLKLQNIAFELKSMLDRDEINELEFKNALKKLDALEK
ncbi:MAG: hypothetical protein LLF83_03510 [Methanobacterium sp.]|nr:hypothetical protein [Methanobacterium sp.]